MISLDQLISLYSRLDRQLHPVYEQEYKLGRNRNRDHRLFSEELGLYGYCSQYCSVASFDPRSKAKTRTQYLVCHAADREIHQTAPTKMRFPLEQLDDCEFCWWGLYLSLLVVVGKLSPDTIWLIHLVAQEKRLIEYCVNEPLARELIEHYQEHHRDRLQADIAREDEVWHPLPFENLRKLPDLPWLKLL